VLVTLPAALAPMVELGAAKLGVLGRLNASARNWSLDPSVTEKFLNNEKS
jgi:hypothetical protein